MKRVLIAGCGYVGSALGLRLVREGHEVWGLRRRTSRLPGEIRPIAADLADEASLREALPAELDDLDELDAVVYAASAGSYDDPAYEAAYVTGTGNLIAALEARDLVPHRFLYVSSTGVYGQSDGSWVDESSPTDKSNFAGHRLLEGETVARASGYPTSVVRFAGIYGPGRTRLIDRVQQGEAVVVRGETVWTNRIHRDDCAGLLDHLISVVDPDRLYLGVDSQPAPLAEVLCFLAEELEVDPPREVAPEEAPESERRRGAGKRCKNSRVIDAGYRFQFPTYREGYRRLVHDLRDET